jgi:hypothetical protein
MKFHDIHIKLRRSHDKLNINLKNDIGHKNIYVKFKKGKNYSLLEMNIFDHLIINESK